MVVAAVEGLVEGHFGERGTADCGMVDSEAGDVGFDVRNGRDRKSVV